MLQKSDCLKTPIATAILRILQNDSRFLLPFLFYFACSREKFCVKPKALFVFSRLLLKFCFFRIQCLTVSTKWDAKVTLTIVYGNGMANGVYDYGANDALDMEQYKPAGANNKFFEGWYTDEGLTEAFEATVITADTTVYVKWTDAGNYTLVSEGSYGFEYNAEGGYWANNNQGVDSTTASIKITALDGPVQVKVTYWISSEANFDYLYSAVNESTLDAIINTKGSNYTQEEAQVGEFMLQQGDTLSFNYKKDSSTSRGDDTAYMILEINGVVVTAYVPAE